MNLSKNLVRKEISPIIWSLLKIHTALENSELIPQKQIGQSLLPQTKEENTLRKRNFAESARTDEFGSGKGRNLKNWVLSTSYLQSYQPACLMA